MSKKNDNLKALTTSGSEELISEADEHENDDNFRKTLKRESIDTNEAKLSQIEKEFKLELDYANDEMTSSKKKIEWKNEFRPKFKTPEQEINELLAMKAKENNDVINVDLKYT